ncbi:MAG: hypothetical protein CMO01_00325 [Thalassobius sp.]|nr:hypothetical protein [Thalassovita sp.]|tara:strand:+ start:281 stop:508 length:228 start_codon:yes stop_codon:yes gene_type:complete
MRQNEKSIATISSGTTTKENAFQIQISDEQIKAHKKRDIKEIFHWLESTNQFISVLQNPSDKQRNKAFKKLVKDN